jgi:hypothetical protein
MIDSVLLAVRSRKSIEYQFYGVFAGQERDIGLHNS